MDVDATTAAAITTAVISVFADWETAGLETTPAVVSCGSSSFCASAETAMAVAMAAVMAAAAMAATAAGSSSFCCCYAAVTDAADTSRQRRGRG